MKFKKIIVWMLMLAMILNLPASTLAATSPVAPCKNHVWGEWDPIEDPTCTTTGKQIRYCEVCFTEQIGTIPKLPHSWDGWTVTKEPTCTSTGSRFHTCTVCGTRETETMDKAPHKYGKWVDMIPATCSFVRIQHHLTVDFTTARQDLTTIDIVIRREKRYNIRYFLPGRRRHGRKEIPSAGGRAAPHRAR